MLTLLVARAGWPGTVSGVAGSVERGLQAHMAKPNDIRVMLVRTGETEWERAGRIAGSTDVPLTPEGWEQVQKNMRELSGVKLIAIFCGPDETSQAIAREIAKVTGGKVKVIEDLGEVHLGLWEGMLESELQEKCPRAYRQWIEDPAAVQVPEGEGFEDAQVRLVQALGRNLDRAKADAGAVGVVLRPVALGLVGCSISGIATSRLWSMIESGPALEWRTIERGSLNPARSKAGIEA